MFRITKEEFYEELDQMNKKVKEMLTYLLKEDLNPDYTFFLCTIKAHIEIMQKDLRENPKTIFYKIHEQNLKSEFWESESAAVRKWKKEPAMERQNVFSQPRGI